MTNDEARMSKEARMIQTRNGPRTRWLRPLRFVILSSLGFRPSSFVGPWIPPRQGYESLFRASFFSFQDPILGFRFSAFPS